MTYKLEKAGGAVPEVDTVVVIPPVAADNDDDIANFPDILFLSFLVLLEIWILSFFCLYLPAYVGGK